MFPQDLISRDILSNSLILVYLLMLGASSTLAELNKRTTSQNEAQHSNGPFLGFIRYCSKYVVFKLRILRTADPLFYYS